MLDNLLSEAENEAGEVRVVPVLVSDLPFHLATLRAIIHHAGGVFLNAEEAAEEGADGPIDARIAAIVEAAIRMPRPEGGELTVRVGTDDTGRIAVEVQGATDEVLPPGLATLRGVATAVLDRRLQSATIGAIAYGEADLEPAGQIAAWSLLTEQLPRQPLGSLRTLVIFLGVGQVEYRRHLGGDVAARYRLNSAGWSRRNSRAVSVNAVVHTTNNQAPWNVFFLGAGFAASSELPLGDELRDHALADLLGDDGSATAVGLAERFHTQLVENDRLLVEERAMPRRQFVDQLTAERVLREERRWHQPAAMPTLIYFRDRNDTAVADRGEAVRMLGEWLRSDRTPPRLVLVTVNFDTLIEAEAGDMVEVFATEARFATCGDYLTEYRANGGPIPLLKLHGTITDPPSVVANVDETVLGLTASRQSSLRRLAEPADDLSPWTYVGYSMRDLDIVPVLRELGFAETVEERWVSPFPDENARRFAEVYRSDIWMRNQRANFSERTIALSADAFFTRLSELSHEGQ
ncbi:MAG: SIR2 family protein [Chloroflexota bacterium]